MSKLTIALSVIIVSFSLFSVGCQGKKQVTISEEKLIAVLADMHLAEAVINNNSPFERDSLAALYYSQIAKIHDLPQTDMMQIVDSLIMDPKRLEPIYEKVVERLNELEVESK